MITTMKHRLLAALDRYRANRIAGVRLELDYLLRHSRRPWQAGKIGGGGALRFPRSRLSDVLYELERVHAHVEFIDLDGAFVAYTEGKREHKD